MSASCDFVEVGVREFLEGAKDLESFSRAMKARFGRDIDPAILRKAFEKAAGRYEKQFAPLNDIKLELAKELSRARRSGIFETVTALRRAGLLSGPKTLVRNVAGNTVSMGFDAIARIPASLVDLVVGRYTGTRTISPFNMDATRRAIQGVIREGFKDAATVMRDGATPADLAKFDVPNELNAYVGNVEMKVFNRYANFILRLQGALDKPFRAFAYNRSLAEQAHILARAEGLKGADRAARINGLMASPPEAMVLQAIADAEQAIFANSNRFADALSAGARTMGPGGKFVLDTIVPFRKVPTNVVGRVLESSPAGAPIQAGIQLRKLIKSSGLDKQAQKQFSMAIGRGASGTLLIALGYKLAQQGRMTGGFTNDRGVSDREEAVGHSPGSLIIGGKSYQLDGSPVGILLAVGASMHRDTTEGKRPVSVVTSAISNAGKEVLNAPFLQGVSDIEGAARRPETEGGRFARGLAGSLVPSFINTAGEALDTVQRRADTPVEAMMARVPGLRQSLPAKRDALGREVSTNNWWNPIEGKEEKPGKLEQELDRLKVRLQKPNRVRDSNSPMFDKDERTYQERVRVVGEEVLRSLERIIASPWYAKASDATKTKRLQAEIAKAKARASERIKTQRNREKRQERQRTATRP